MAIKKVAIIGPESTGKSELTKQLAAHFHTFYAEEFAREYLKTNGTNYTFDNLWEIAIGQMQGEDNAMNLCRTYGKNIFFSDTDMNVIKVWSEFVFNACDNRVLQQIVARNYDFYLLCDTDLPWIKDELREYPDYKTRKKLFHYYHDLLIHQQAPWGIVRGQGSARTQNAIDLVRRYLFA